MSYYACFLAGVDAAEAAAALALGGAGGALADAALRLLLLPSLLPTLARELPELVRHLVSAADV